MSIFGRDKEGDCRDEHPRKMPLRLPGIRSLSYFPLREDSPSNGFDEGGKWEKKNSWTELYNKTLGVIGIASSERSCRSQESLKMMSVMTPFLTKEAAEKED
jgi:hypothetical protein